ncbi:MAG: hypothetical protein QM714_00285 [Nocardioides sp.]|uniref:hypothetical protein n=1 Tax=Nocardioides sp. TaxID=35761 RepID=UPI0039E47C76
MGVTFDPWQEGAARLVLGKDKADRYACTVGGVVWSIPRQVGKTFTVGSLIIAICIEFPGTKVLWTAHRTKTATDAFRAMQGMVKRKRVRPHLAPTRTDGIKAGHADQEIMFRNGSLIMFGAREQGFGRGFTNIDIEVFDEAQILGTKALEDMVAATNQAQHPHGALLFYLGTPPRPEDPSEAFREKRNKALSGKSTNLIYIEFSAEPDSDPDDRAQWPMMNPSYPKRTPTESLLRLRENLPGDDSWNREGRGIWDPVASAGVIPATSWAERADERSLAVDRFALGVECGPDLSWASVAFAGQRKDEAWHFELDEDQHTKGRGVAWLVPHVQYLTEHNSQIRSVVVDVAGPVAALLEQRADRWFFKGTRLAVTPVKVAELGAGCSRVLDGVVTGWLRHIDQPQFTAAALAAGKRPLGDTGMWVWSRKTAESDITPIQAGTLALIGAQASTVRKPTRKSGGRRVVTT